MQEWEYDELQEAVEYRYKKTIEEGRNCLVAAARCYYELEPIIDEGPAESLIYHTTLGKLCLEHGRIPVSHYESIMKDLETFDPDQLQGELTAEEIIRLSKDIDLVKKELATIEIVHDNKLE